MKRPQVPVIHARTALVLGLLCLPAVFAHGGDEAEHGAVHGDEAQDSGNQPNYPPTYFSHPEFAGLMYAHIVLMTISWVFVLPLASRYTLVLQFVFLAVNAAGLLLGGIYNAKTPDLYPNNAHHKIGWIITWIVSAHVFVSLLSLATKSLGKSERYVANEEQHFLPVSWGALEDYNDAMRRQSLYGPPGDRVHHMRATSESLRSHSGSTAVDDEEGSPMPSPHKEYAEDEDDNNLEDVPLHSEARKNALAEKLKFVVSSRVWKYISVGYKVVDRILLPFGFIAFATGVVTYGRLFEGHAIFGGLAHWIKGGVFFWLGILTLGRWAGSFAELGWAWNVRPQKARKNSWRPSAEFVESFLIFFYGATNIFLEHLGDTKGTWSPQDFEHISITVLFLGGGLCGMLIESRWVRDLLNVSISHAEHYALASDEEKEQIQAPTTYNFSLNPIPALVILLLGIMMSSHQQTTMISTMVHKQWGEMLLGASFARGLTYILVFLKPPRSIYPSRPPTELLAAFGLISGGILFMASSSDTVKGMIHYDMDAMFMYTVTMGLVGLLMAWEILVLSVKGWALRKERYLNGQRSN